MSETHSSCEVEYRPIPDFPGYFAGSDGTIIGKRGKLLKFGDNGTGYACVTIPHRDGKVRNVKVHRLVLLAFVGPPPAGMECLHGPGSDKRNNSIGNLKWGTRSENVSELNIRIGRRPVPKFGSENNAAKLTEDKVRQIRQLHADGMSHRALGRRFGVYHQTIMKIVKREHWRHVT